jgi:hypothetical protein
MPTSSPVRLAFLLALFSGLGACSAPRVDVMPRLMQAKLDGTLAASNGGGSLTSNDLADDLGMDETADELGARVDMVLGGSTFTFSYAPASFSGSGTLTGDITHGGTTITAGTNVTTDSDLNVSSAIWTHDFVPGENLELGLGLGVQVLDFSAKLVSATDTVTFDQTIPLPVLAGRAGAAFGPFDVSALVTGMGGTYSGNDGSFVDLDLMGRWRFFGGVAGELSGSLVLGWKKTDVKLDYEDGSDRTKGDVNISGIYYGLSIGF